VQQGGMPVERIQAPGVELYAQRYRIMADGFKQLQNGRQDNSWLSMLVDTMNAVSEPQAVRCPCDSWVVDALKAKLERPASANRIAKRHLADLTPTF